MNETKKNNSLEYYLNLDYPITVYADEKGGFVAEIEDLPGCLTQGETIEEIYEAIQDAKRSWMEVAYQQEMDIPLPRSNQEFSGKFILRLPKYLHRKLSKEASKEGVSLNQYVGIILAADMYHQIAALTEMKESIDRVLDECRKVNIVPPANWAYRDVKTFKRVVRGILPANMMNEREFSEEVAA